MNNQNKNCSLHNKPFEYFCQKCYEPVCKQCTVIGPHNTPIHSITNIADAYERRVNQIKERITIFLENKATIIESIETLNYGIEQLKLLKEKGVDENQRYKSKMLQQLQKQQQWIRNELGLIKEHFEVKLNQINDLGHQFENIQDNIQIIASHSRILESIKECMDRLNILLEQKQNIPELNKELSDLRLDLKSIEVYQGFIDQKMRLIQEIFTLMNFEKSKIERPTIDFDVLLKQLQSNITECIEHNVCHYCGIVFSFESVNTACPKNNSGLDINEFVGFCSKKPDSVRWATHRHYFAEPADSSQYFKQDQNSTFSIHLKALLLRLKTICVIKKINLFMQFMMADKSRAGVCNKIEMTYILMEICGLTNEQSQIILTLCEQPTKNTYKYSGIIERLSGIDIEFIDKKNTGIPEIMRNMVGLPNEKS